jgi:polar amino acid transport system substrate-binding protein
MSWIGIRRLVLHPVLYVGLLAGVAAALPAPAHAAPELLPLYVGYADPPLSTSRPDSLTIRLAGALSAQSHGRYRFRATQLPRKRLLLTIGDPAWKGVVAWANPAWFNDPAMQRYLWSAPFMNDTNLVVSHRDHPLDYNGDIRALAGLRVGTIFGQRYADLDPLFRDHSLQRNDVASELQNLQKLQLRRLDVVLIQASSLPYFREQLPDLDQWLYVAHTPRNSFQRYLFTGRRNAELMAFLNAALAELARDREWQALFDSAARR